MAATGNEPDIRTINPAAMTTKPSRNTRRSPTLFPGPGRPPAYLRPLRSLLVEMKGSLNPSSIASPVSLSRGEGFKDRCGIRRGAESTGGPHDLGTSEPPVSDHPADGRSHRDARGRPRILPRPDAQARDPAEDVGAAPPLRGRNHGHPRRRAHIDRSGVERADRPARERRRERAERRPFEREDHDLD